MFVQLEHASDNALPIIRRFRFSYTQIWWVSDNRGSTICTFYMNTSEKISMAAKKTEKSGIPPTPPFFFLQYLFNTVLLHEIAWLKVTAFCKKVIFKWKTICLFVHLLTNYLKFTNFSVTKKPPQKIWILVLVI